MNVKIWEQVNRWIQQNIVWILPLLTLGILVLLILSYLIPKKVIDTYKTNITEEEGDTEYLIPLEKKSKITYHMNTGSRPIMGIHIGVSKNGNTFTEETIRCDVFTDNQKTPVSSNTYILNQKEDIQYIYIPFENYTACKGDITILFTYQPLNEASDFFPSVLANGKKIGNTYTQVNDNRIEGNIKSIYIYTHDTFPLVYDLRILLAVFAAASMAVNYKGSLQKFTSRRNVHEK